MLPYLDCPRTWGEPGKSNVVSGSCPHGGFHGKQCAPRGHGTQNGWPDDMLEWRLISGWAGHASACKMRARGRSAASLRVRGTLPKTTRDFMGNSAPRVGMELDAFPADMQVRFVRISRLIASTGLE